mgnify:CR=1 FL=1
MEMKSSSDRTSKKGSRKSVSIAPPLCGTRDRLQSRDRLKRHPQEGQHSADAERGGTRDRVPPARDTICNLRHLPQMANQVACNGGGNTIVERRSHRSDDNRLANNAVEP